MSYDSRAKTCMNQILLRNALLYRWSTVKDFSAELREKSGKAFSRGSDQEATWLRSLAENMEERARGLRREYDEGKPEENQWDRLAQLLLEQGGWREPEGGES